MRQATRAYNQRVADIKTGCDSIDYRELLNYPQNHEGECVSIKGQIWNIRLDKHYIEIEVGFYSGEVLIDVENIPQNGNSLYEDDWVTVYGYVRYGEWTNTNAAGDVKKEGSIDPVLIVGPHDKVWGPT